MAFAAKSGTTRGESGFTGDIRSHLMKITVDSESMFTEDGAWVRDDDEREASLSPAYSCLGCHNNDPNDNIPDKTLEEAVEGANDMHETDAIATHSELEMSIYPNPSNGPTKISFVTNEADVTVSIFSISGQLVYQVENISDPSGTHVIYWDGASNTGTMVESGYYFIKITAGTLTSTKKLVLMN